MKKLKKIFYKGIYLFFLIIRIELFAMAESGRRMKLLKNKKKFSKGKWSNADKNQKICATLPISEGEDDLFVLIGMDSKHILIADSNNLIIYCKSSNKIISTIRLNYPASNLILIKGVIQGEHKLFKFEQNQLEILEIKFNTLHSCKNYVFTSGIKHAVSHPSGDFVFTLNVENVVGIFDLIKVLKKSI